MKPSCFSGFLEQYLLDSSEIVHYDDPYIVTFHIHVNKYFLNVYVS
jgi:hypothetical protein